MISVSVGEAKNKLTYFLHLIEENGESVEIKRHGKTVAFINNQENSSAIDKKKQFTEGLNKWRSKYEAVLSQIQNDEIDSIFSKRDDSEPLIRHPEDFN